MCLVNMYVTRSIQIFFVFLIFCACQTVQAQNFSNTRTKTLIINHLIENTNATAFAGVLTCKPIDSLLIDPSSLQILQFFPKNSQIRFIYQTANNCLNVKTIPNFPIPDSILVQYKVLPIKYLQKIQNRKEVYLADTSVLGESTEENYTPNNTLERNEFFSDPNFQKNGTIARGISFGNRQDVFVNSALNLQVEGKITEDLELTAVLTDQNVPFQPEGNTQELQQFDRIFLQLRHRYASLSAGDIVLRNPENHFLRYYKNVLGVSLSTTYGADSSKIRTQAAASVAKGQFFSMLVPVQEGVQGAYRLRGANGERFIIILANSERVFVDGQLKQRGFNYDYVIDYNTSEITFTNRVLMTQFTRVRVDFEYATQRFNRNLLTANHLQKIGKVKITGNFYQEADNPQNPIIEFTSADRRVLYEAGDSTLSAVGTSATRSNEWTDSQVLYIQQDTISNNQIFKIFVRALITNTELWNVSFTEVGENRGNYRLANSANNGRVFEWIAPINGLPQGNFAPIRVLPLPNRKQMLAAGFSYQMTDNQEVFLETAFSNHDQNLLSPLQDSDNRGYALRVGYKSSGENLAFFSAYRWQAQIDYEFDNQSFRPIDRFRYIEFDRDWSADTEKLAQDQIINFAFDLSPALTLQNSSSFSYRLTLRQRENEVKGFQQNVSFSKKLKKMQIESSFFWLQNEKSNALSDWKRLNIHLFYQNKTHKTGYQFEQDRNTIQFAKSDSIIGTAMFFDQHRFYVQTTDSTKWKLMTDYIFRTDQSPLQGKMQVSNRSNTFNFLLQKTTKSLYFNWLVTYRRFETLIGTKPMQEENLMNRLDWNVRLWKNAVRSELTFSNANGRELRREYRFLRVDAGQGTHTWRDDNGNGIQEINEFYEALNPDEKIYIKFFVPTDQYLPAFTNQFSYRLNAQAPSLWLLKKNFVGFLAKWNGLFAWTIFRRMTDPDVAVRFLPFLNPKSEHWLSDNQNLRGVLFFNRTSTRYAAELSYVQNKTLQLLTNGFERRQKTDFQANMRYALSQHWVLQANIGQGKSLNLSDFLENRNYEIRSFWLQPEIAFQPNSNQRLSVQAIWKDKKAFGSTEKAIWQEINLQMLWTKAGKQNINAQIRYTNIAFGGEANSPIGYEMLEALRRGTNLLWNVTWTQRISNGLQITVQYNGRKAEGQAVVHLGQMQLAALL